MKVNSHLFGRFVRRFLLNELVTSRNLSFNTQHSYRDTIRLLFKFIEERYSIKPDKVMTEHVTSIVVCDFLSDLETKRENSIATRNQRLAALHSLFHFISRQAPELVEHATSILAIPTRRADIPTITYLNKQEMNALLAVPNRQRPQGRRDYALLLFLYNTGARASEAAAATLNDIDLDVVPSARLIGKGRKPRLCPLWSHTTDVLRELLAERGHESMDAPLFLNVHRKHLTRYGVHALIARTVKKAIPNMPSLKNKRVSPHTIRHTTATHLLQAGVDINTIRAWLGHVSLETTNRYAEINLDMKAAALEACAVRGNKASEEKTIPIWRKDNKIMEFLTTL